jgi:hypothetical protein
MGTPTTAVAYMRTVAHAAARQSRLEIGRRAAMIVKYSTSGSRGPPVPQRRTAAISSFPTSSLASMPSNCSAPGPTAKSGSMAAECPPVV